MIIILYYNRVPDLEIFVWGGGVNFHVHVKVISTVVLQ